MASAGEVATAAGLLGTWRTPLGAVTFEAGLDVEWVVFEEVAGEAFVDDTPFLAFYTFGLVYECPIYEDANLSARLEYALPHVSEAYPAQVLGGFPRLLFGGSFAP